jgi:ribosomal protein L28
MLVEGCAVTGNITTVSHTVSKTRRRWRYNGFLLSTFSRLIVNGR